MKTIRLLLATALALAVLVGVALALAWWQPATARAKPLQEWWENWYFKDPYPDYAPSGVPDFDQKQDLWDNPPGSRRWTYCGPVAAANSLWWFDSKFEPYPVQPPPINDNYYLVTPYWAEQDDHDPKNVGGGLPGLPLPSGLVDDLACYFGTDVGIMGTEVHAMAHGLQWYLYNDPTHPCYIYYRSNGGSTYDEYHVQLVEMPTFEWVEEEVERSEDVILLLGFWQEQPAGSGLWVRLGGHYVTVAGINSEELQIAFSDPYFDNAEAGGPGRVLSGTLLAHYPPHPGPDPTIHNDAGNVSHDFYAVTLDAISPGGLWEIEGYEYAPNFELQNCPEEFRDYQGGPMADPILVEVEYALAMSPFYWKPGGEWVWQWWNETWFWEWWWYEDDGDSCLPDFWWGLGVDWEAYDGPVAVANSLWWFDSKAETLKTGGFPEDPQTAITDHYSLVEAYGDWDDHAISNTVPLIDDLAAYLGTGAQGTTPAGMTTGIGDYLVARGVADDFYTKTQESPSFEWVADEVETCEDVILLLSFWENSDGEWERKGGHWVNAAGVNRENMLIGLSDPALNNAVNPSVGSTMYPGRVFPPERLGVPFLGDEQSAPQNISHDIYRVITSTSPGGEWALVDYPAELVVDELTGKNGEGSDWTGHPISTEVEWAIAVSPHSDLVLTKTAVVTEVVPGDRVTYTLEYANVGLAAADHVTITDLLPLEYLTDIAYTSWPPLRATSDVTYVWTLPRLSYGQRGVITITADSLVTATLYNTAHITGLNAIDDPTPDRDPTNNTATICDPVDNVGLQYTPSDPWVGETIAFTATATGSSPISYTWSADDGWLASGSTQSHAFATQGNHTVWLTATNACGQDYASTVIFVREHGVDLRPDSAGLTEKPGQTVTYTLTAHNTGNVADTYDIAGAVSDPSWPASWPASVGPVAASGSAQFDVTVQIPSGASDGAWSQVVITATSQGDGSKQDASKLTTYAQSTITRSITVTPTSPSVSGDPGDTVCFTITITNSGNVTDTVDIIHTFPVSWTVTFTPPPPYELGPGEGQTVQVCITIPPGAGAGGTESGTVTVISGGDPDESADVDVTVRVGWKFIYLPVVIRNYP